MKNEIIKIAKDLEQGEIDLNTARNILLSLFDVSGSLQDRLFEIANDFAKNKQGEVAVKLHSIHNGLQ